MLIHFIDKLYGRYVHDRCRSFGNDSDHVTGRRTFPVPDCCFACAARPCSRLVCGIRDSQDSRGNSKNTLEVLACFVMTLLLGASFSLPVKAETMYDNTALTVTGQQSFGPYTHEVWTINTSSTFFVNDLSLILCNSNATTSLQLKVHNTGTGVTWYASSTVSNCSSFFSTTTFSNWYNDEAMTVGSSGPVIDANVTSTLQSSNDEQWEVDYNVQFPTVIPEPPGSSLFVNFTHQLGNDVFWVNNHDVIYSHYGEPKIIINGDLLESITPETHATARVGTILGAVPLPTSMYSNATMTQYLPTLGWSNDSASSSQVGTYQSHLNEMLGTATATFPLCLSYPWFGLVDVIERQTFVDQQSVQGLTLSSGMVPTTTIDLSSFPSWIADTGMKDTIDTISTYAQALAWLLFGLFVFEDLFKPKDIE